MSGYGQFCPVAVACEVLAERWTPLVLRELLCGSTRFNDLRRGLPQMSPSLLSKRLKTLERAGVVARDGSGYVLTDAGQELRPLIEGLGVWGQRWSRGLLDDDKLDASLLLWDMHRRVDRGRLPDHRVVVAFVLRGSVDRRSHFWLVLDGADVDLCVTDPGFDVDLTVNGHVRTLARYWSGRASLVDLVRTGELEVTGPRELVRGFPTWFLRGAFAEVQPASA